MSATTERGRTPGLTGAIDPLEAVQLLAETLAATEHVDEVAAGVVDALAEILGATAVMMGLHDEHGAHLVPLASRGLSARTEMLLTAPIELVDGEPAHSVLTNREPLFWSSTTERDASFPRYASFATEHQSWSVLPLLTRDADLGILAVGWPDARDFEAADRMLLGAIAHQCAVALDRAALLQAEREERQRSHLLAEGTRIMASALDPDEILRRLVRLAVPALAPFCAVYVAEEDSLRRIAMEVAAESAASSRLRQFAEVPIQSAAPLAVAYRSGVVQVVPEVSRELVTQLYPAELAEELLAAAGETRRFSALVVPVLTGGRPIGVMSLVSDAWGGAPNDRVVEVAEGLAGRAGVALNVARRYQREHETAIVLTEALLPSTHPTPPCLEVASRYLPIGGSVAGDWFDVARAAPDRYVLGVGDAAGHGIRAAALMTELRSAARGLAASGASPAELLHGLDWLLTQSTGEFATALYAETDGTARRVTWASAGHPSPVLVSDRGARALATTRATPLGCPFGDQPRDESVELAAGDALVLYTDGVVERRAGGYQARSDQLVALLDGAREAPAEEVASAVAAELCVDREDDCCVLVLRRTG